MDREDIRAYVCDLPEVATWPDLVRIFSHALSHPRQDWEWPLLACRAVQGDEAQLVPVAAALMSVQLSITLVDDILDADPRGVHLEIGAGETANVSLALQALALHLIGRLEMEAARRAAIMHSLAQMALGTAYGQSLDVQNLSGEANYWRVLKAKSTPFYGTALQIGAFLGQVEPEVIDGIYRFGALNGEIIQVFDDLNDALQTPANPDWKQGRSNLLILYALTTQHQEREQFYALLPDIQDARRLRLAHQILLRSGAVSYATYELIKRCQAARQLLESLAVPDPAPLRSLLTHQVQPIAALLKSLGAEIPAELQLT